MVSAGQMYTLTVYFIPRHDLPFILWAEFLLSYQQFGLTVVFIRSRGMRAAAYK